MASRTPIQVALRLKLEFNQILKFYLVGRLTQLNINVPQENVVDPVLYLFYELNVPHFDTLVDDIATMATAEISKVFIKNCKIRRIK